MKLNDIQLRKLKKTATEFYPNNIKTTNFTLINKYSKFTDDTILPCAVTEAVMALMPKRGDKVLETDFENEVIKSMRFLANRYPRAKYGRNFVSWLVSENPTPYKSYGNGSAMIVSSVA